MPPKQGFKLHQTIEMLNDIAKKQKKKIAQSYYVEYSEKKKQFKRISRVLTQATDRCPLFIFHH